MERYKFKTYFNVIATIFSVCFFSHTTAYAATPVPSVDGAYGGVVNTPITIFADSVAYVGWGYSGTGTLFEVDWDNNGTVDGTAPACTTGNCVRVIRALGRTYSTVGTHTMRVRTTDGSYTSAWSAPFTFTIYSHNGTWGVPNTDFGGQCQAGGYSWLAPSSPTPPPGSSCTNFYDYYFLSGTGCPSGDPGLMFPGDYQHDMEHGTVYSCLPPGPDAAPSAPTLGGTNSIGTGVSTSNTVGATDPEGDAVYYEIDWDGNGTVDGTTSSQSSGVSTSIGHTYSTAGTYGVRARAVQTSDPSKISAWSAAYNITVNPASYNCEAGSLNPSLNIVSNNTLIGIALNSGMRWFHNAFYGACYQNTSGLNYFVPTKTQGEFNSFRDHLPPGVSKANGGW
jgi:hypothetical protein